MREAERLGLQIILGSGPGWAGSGGPWIKPAQSMQHLVAQPVEVEGPGKLSQRLPAAPAYTPFFGPLKGEMRPFEAIRQAAFGDVAVLAFPTPTGAEKIPDSDQKALYYRPAFTSGGPSVRPFFKTQATYPDVPPGGAIAPERVLDLTRFLKPDGTLDWDIPPGHWTVLRFVSRNNGNITRPAPSAGLGFEVDKFSAAAFDFHYDTYVGQAARQGRPAPAGRRLDRPAHRQLGDGRAKLDAGLPRRSFAPGAATTRSRITRLTAATSWAAERSANGSCGICARPAASWSWKNTPGA